MKGIKMSNYNENINIWKDIYHSSDFGNKYPSTNMVSIFHNMIKPVMARKNNKILDFGCSLGANTKVFADLGFEVYGIDISQKAIDLCVERNGFKKENFVVADILSSDKTIKEIFEAEFDLILALNCLYYFSNYGIEKAAAQFADVMGEDSVFYANLHTSNTYFLTDYEKHGGNEEGLLRVAENGNVKEMMYYNVVADKREMEDKFHMFQKIGISQSSLELNGNLVESLHFIGKKY